MEPEIFRVSTWLAPTLRRKILEVDILFHCASSHRVTGLDNYRSIKLPELNYEQGVRQVSPRSDNELGARCLSLESEIGARAALIDSHKCLPKP